MTQTLPILIAGGGIGGLATAIGLAQKGIASLVLEKAPALGEIGAGIQLGPNAFHAFDYLGVGDAARDIAVYIDSLRLMDAIAGTEITRIPLDDAFRSRFGNPYAVIHRGDLHKVFLTACADHPLVDLRTDSEVVDYEQDGATVTAILADGTRVTGRLLIGADGLWSNVRKRVVGDGAPRVSGHTTYRSVIPTEDMPEDLRWNAATLWAGPKCHIVHYPLKGWKLFNLVVTYHNDAPSPEAGVPVSHDEVKKGFEHVAPVARQIIDRGQSWKRWVLCDRDPVSNWIDGRVALLGDAAHPMLQYFAQGACMAMEDAVALAYEMDRLPNDPEAALQSYQELRRLRTARVQLQSREIGQHVYHAAGAHAELRNAVMRAKSPNDWYDVVDWLYGSTGLEGAVSAESHARAG
ncbi:3-hydroxybenzoate 6-monooxygenase [Tropicimonas sp. IMCC34043]|uniref:3-hydroxybenzoate 6-monooxygenase n=1 Tax=Tropicimonas sp. IMCC34043 TaxID=2248760 RepID=UPI000E27DA9B|nr:3-hydroxybenzoate 6-monooxygenase [Tropicimonas sp. IMCC34043]